MDGRLNSKNTVRRLPNKANADACSPWTLSLVVTCLLILSLSDFRFSTTNQRTPAAQYLLRQRKKNDRRLNHREGVYAQTCALGRTSRWREQAAVNCGHTSHQTSRARDDGYFFLQKNVDDPVC